MKFIKPFFQVVGSIAAFLIGLWFLRAFLNNKPVSSSDVASWAQAVGSILAVCVAIWVPWASDKSRRRESSKGCIVFHAKLMQAIADLGNACAISNAESVAKHRLRLNELVRFGRTLNLSTLDSEEIWAFFDSLSIAVQADDYAMSVDLNLNLPFRSARFEQWLTDLEKTVREFHKVPIGAIAPWST